MCSNKKVWLFVYGSLKKGYRAHTKLEEQIQIDSIKGELFSHDIIPFPFAKLSGEGIIHGELHLIPYSILWVYDAIENSLYKRKEVVTNSGVPCYIYEYLGDTSKFNKIENGRW